MITNGVKWIASKSRKTIEKPYKDIIAEIQEVTAKGTSYAKKLCKIWIEKNLITKNYNNLYEKRF